MRSFIKYFIVVFLGTIHLGYAQELVSIQGVVKDNSGEIVIGATVVIKENNKFGQTDSNGRYIIPKLQSNKQYTVEVSYIGYTFFSQKVTVNGDKVFSITLTPDNYNLSEINIQGKSKVQLVKEKAYNVAVVDAVKLHNRALDIGQALDKTSGVRVRQDGGVGSAMNISLNGYSGNQIKFFIDGIPMDNFGSAFQMNNIPINLANRIEIYKGVVPVGLGSDALGGAVNIITNTYDKTSLDMSYSYGSFNTHRTNVNFVFVDKKSGFFTQLNAYQNYSDNDYKVRVNVNDITSGKIIGQNIKVKRFHDKYHNENFIGQIGFINKSFADRIAFGINLGQSYKEVQTAARMEAVFGNLHQRGDIVMPTFVYKKNNLFTEGLDVSVNANYNLGSDQVIDTVYRRYNWLGDYVDFEEMYGKKGGERNRTMYKYKNNNGMVNTIVNYKLGDKHNFSLSNTINFFKRKGKDELYPDDVLKNKPSETTKNISGLSYQYTPSTIWGVTVFGKYYNQHIKYTDSYNPSGQWGDYAYRNYSKDTNDFGYGITGSVFVREDLQLKTSFEKSVRLPASSELFGDKVNITGNFGLKPEISYNYNIGVTYQPEISKNHSFILDINGFYIDSKDFIYQEPSGTNKNETKFGNLAAIKNTGVEGEIRYFFKRNFNIGVNGTYQNLINTNKYVGGVESILYKDRLPNIPYLYGNIDVNYTFNKVFKDDNLTLGYSVSYIKEFYLYWPSLGKDKFNIPDQVSHDFVITYSFGKDTKYQFTFEGRNILDKMIYDNFSLQKPGRSFVGKFRYFF
ncbi:TonB-dependent receptor [Myroides odoratimimus]|uniref:TonB-dependent receptor n=1 Tax=Myroides odoratimimus TaxID=76832 RepID=UPI002575AA6C|nr:TonB-dependent receptor [Myroides odoratimimus]MDM1097536.1 TonB-dependent receptor [Myroides odoratimimus]